MLNMFIKILLIRKFKKIFGRYSTMVIFQKTAIAEQDYSIPVLDHTGKKYQDLINWTLQDIDSLSANAQNTPGNIKT